MLPVRPFSPGCQPPTTNSCSRWFLTLIHAATGGRVRSGSRPLGDDPLEPELLAHLDGRLAVALLVRRRLPRRTVEVELARGARGVRSTAASIIE